MGKSLGGGVKECERRIVLENFFEKIRNKEINFSPEEETNARRARNFLRKMENSLVEDRQNRKINSYSLAGKLYTAFGGDIENPNRSEILEYASEIMQMKKRIGKILKNPEEFYNSEEYPIFLEDLAIICYGCA